MKFSRALACTSVVSMMGLLFAPEIVAAAAQSYKIDGVHTSVLFRAKRMDVVNIYGRFNEVSGSITADADNPEKSSVEITIKTQSIDTGETRRDDHLRSPDFFNAKQFPTIVFKSTKVTKVGENTYEITGDLTLHGVTKSITGSVEMTGKAKDPRRGQSLIGFETTLTIKRSDFGMKFMLGPVSDEIQITLAVHAVGG